MQFLKAALLGSALVALIGSAHATTFNFSYSFDPAGTSTGGAVTITGSFEGTEIGDLISNITNASVFMNGTAYTGPLIASNGDTTGTAVISTDLAKNDFSFYDAGFNNAFAISGGQASAVNFALLDAGNNALSGAESADAARWTLTAAAVPEPATYLLMVGGLAAIGFVSRRRRQA